LRGSYTVEGCVRWRTDRRPRLRYITSSGAGSRASARSEARIGTCGCVPSGVIPLQIAIEPEASKMNNMGYPGLIGLLVLVGDIWAIINIFQSSVSGEKKLIWIIAVLLLPLLGLILWYFLGPRSGSKA
jgi:hypothetical protein